MTFLLMTKRCKQKFRSDETFFIIIEVLCESNFLRTVEPMRFRALLNVSNQRRGIYFGLGVEHDATPTRTEIDLAKTQDSRGDFQRGNAEQVLGWIGQ